MTARPRPARGASWRPAVCRPALRSPALGHLVLAVVLATGGPGPSVTAMAGTARATPAGTPQLSVEQARTFRGWMLRIIDEQVRQGPSPRWQHRDCAGLVRYAVNETLRPHDAQWRRASGIAGPLPQELELNDAQKALRNVWVRTDGSRGAYVNAIGLIQKNTRFVSRDANQALPGDLLFFDQGDDQHVMVWMGSYIAYHTGSSSTDDNGLRTVALSDLHRWEDTRWRPHEHNPNFIGIFRFNFLPR